MKIVRLRKSKKVALPPSSIVTRSISRHKLRMAEQAVEDVSTGSEAQAPPGFAPEDLRNIADRHSQLQADNAFLRQQMASMQSSIDLLLSKFPQQVTEAASAPNETSEPWIADGDVLFAPPFRSTQIGRAHV